MGRLSHGGIMLHFVHHAGHGKVITAGGGRQITNNAVKQLLNALPLLSAGKKHRKQGTIRCPPAQRLNQLVLIHGCFFEVCQFHRLIKFRCRLQGILPVIFRCVNPAVVASRRCNRLRNKQPSGQFLANLAEHFRDSATKPVHFIDQDQGGNMELFERFPQKPCL